MALPRYGNWGGPEYSAGHDCPTGQKLTAEDLKVPGKDLMDRLFKQHDIDYEQAEELGKVSKLAEKLAILKADQDLVDGLKALDKNDPNTFENPIVGMNYYRQALPAFIAKIGYDKINVLSSLNILSIAGMVGQGFDMAQRFFPVRCDPLTLDLDGDGIETIALNATSPILFDHDGDGIKTGTGWVKGDDGFLALDRDGNGTIDSGRELFGDSTPLFDTEGHEIGKAEDGFDA